MKNDQQEKKLESKRAEGLKAVEQILSLIQGGASNISELISKALEIISKLGINAAAILGIQLTANAKIAEQSQLQAEIPPAREQENEKAMFQNKLEDLELETQKLKKKLSEFEEKHIDIIKSAESIILVRNDLDLEAAQKKTQNLIDYFKNEEQCKLDFTAAFKDLLSLQDDKKLLHDKHEELRKSPSALLAEHQSKLDNMSKRLAGLGQQIEQCEENLVTSIAGFQLYQNIKQEHGNSAADASNILARNLRSEEFNVVTKQIRDSSQIFSLQFDFKSHDIYLMNSDTVSTDFRILQNDHLDKQEAKSSDQDKNIKDKDNYYGKFTKKIIAERSNMEKGEIAR